MAGCELGLGRMAYNIPFHLQHYDPHTSWGAHTSSGKVASVAVSETKVAVPVSIRPCSSSRLRGFSIRCASDCIVGMRGRGASAGMACQENQANDTNIPKPESLKETCNHGSLCAVHILPLFHRTWSHNYPMGWRHDDNRSVYRVWIRKIIEKMGERRVQRHSTIELGIWRSRVLHLSVAYP